MDPAIGRFTSVDPLAERYYSISPYAYVGNNPINAIDINGDSITVTRANGDYLFMLDDGQKSMNSLTAKQLYDRGVQWFAPDADNYMPFIGAADNISESDAYKHFSSDEIMEFADKDRPMTSYRSGGSGDWKQSKDGGAGYLLVTVDGKPYWGDAVGQVPFTINMFKNSLKASGNKSYAVSQTIETGRKYGDGGLFSPSLDASNSYDNAMISRTANWATKAYGVQRNIFNYYVISKTGYSPKSLFNY